MQRRLHRSCEWLRQGPPSVMASPRTSARDLACRGACWCSRPGRMMRYGCSRDITVFHGPRPSTSKPPILTVLVSEIRGEAPHRPRRVGVVPRKVVGGLRRRSGPWRTPGRRAPHGESCTWRTTAAVTHHGLRRPPARGGGRIAGVHRQPPSNTGSTQTGGIDGAAHDRRLATVVEGAAEEGTENEGGDRGEIAVRREGGRW
jgi:hypothetical protein